MVWRVRLTGILMLLAVVVLAGCVEPAGRLRLDPVTGTELADHASRSVDGVHDRPADTIVPAAVENESVTVTEQNPPIKQGLPFAYSGAYYNLSWTTVNTSTAVSVSVSTAYTDALPNGSRIAYSDLPAPDRRIADDLFPVEQRFPGETAPDEIRRFAASAVYNATEQDMSVFFPTQAYDAVVYNGTAYTIRVTEPRQVTLYTYRYTADQVAASPAAYTDQLQDRYLFTLSNLSRAEREVVSRAVGDSYYAEDDNDAAFQALLERFHQYPAVTRSEYDGTWIVQYDGTTYWADLSFSGFSER